MRISFAKILYEALIMSVKLRCVCQCKENSLTFCLLFFPGVKKIALWITSKCVVMTLAVGSSSVFASR